jgi:hypothetical protein
MRAPLRVVVERIGRHAVRLEYGHVEMLAVGEADAVGRRLPCERCAPAAAEDEHESDAEPPEAA